MEGTHVDERHGMALLRCRCIHKLCTSICVDSDSDGDKTTATPTAAAALHNHVFHAKNMADIRLLSSMVCRLRLSVSAGETGLFVMQFQHSLIPLHQPASNWPRSPKPNKYWPNLTSTTEHIESPSADIISHAQPSQPTQNKSF